MGPDSVEYRISREALCFGGEICTATDVAIAAGVAPPDFCTHLGGVDSLPANLVYDSMRQIHHMIEEAIDIMKVWAWCGRGMGMAWAWSLHVVVACVYNLVVVCVWGEGGGGVTE